MTNILKYSKSLLEIADKPVLGYCHDTPKAVLISMDEYTALASAPESRINTLSAEFDSLLMRMQRPGVRKSMQAAFRASPKQLGKAAVVNVAARKRG